MGSALMLLQRRRWPSPAVSSRTADPCSVASRRRGCRLAGVEARWAEPDTARFARVILEMPGGLAAGCARCGGSAVMLPRLRWHSARAGSGYPEGTARSPS